MEQSLERERFFWHSTSVSEVLARLKATPEGLSEEEAESRLAAIGPNVIPRARREGPLRLLWRQIDNPLIYVLLGSALIAIVMGKLLDGLVVLGVVVLNTLIGFVQEFRAGKAIEALIGMVPETATVRRSGERRGIPAAELVPGDVILLQAGDKVPADVRLLSVRGLRAEEAALTGESVATEKQSEPVAEDAVLGDRASMAFGGTLIVAGTGAAVVVATGVDTELGRISALLREASEIETPLTRAMARVGKYLTYAILAVAGALLGVALLRGFPWLDALLAGITLAVAAIPEGLPAIITIALAIGVQRMARRRAVIRRLPAVETLGSTTVICSDKTGTLTRNEMTVQALWTPRGGLYRLSGVGYAPEGELSRGDERFQEAPPDVRELLTAGLLCNDSSLRREKSGWRVEGDPTEGALLVAARKVLGDAEEIARSWPREDAIPFTSELRFMATLHRGSQGTRVMFLKGAPEEILAHCTTASGGERLDREAVFKELEALASEGMRLLAFAVKHLERLPDTIEEAEVQGGFTLLGLQAMIDPPRPEAIRAIATCRQAGIVVKMITGDHRITAQAIGYQLGLLQPGEQAMSGAEIEALSEEELGARVEAVSVFARVAPEHKLRLVRALQARGHVVAMTGDGVNDAPALKQANIGVAMGITGTAVSQEAADMVLTDDNFASIESAVEEGRRVYDNLIKSLAFVLPTNVGEALIVLAAVLFFPVVGGQPLLPALPVQILWINLVATVTLALPLAFEAMEPGIMKRPPRPPDAPILSAFVLYRMVAVAVLMALGAIGLFLWEYFADVRAGTADALALREAQTVAVTTVVLFQIFYLINCRSLLGSVWEIGLFSNRYVYVGIGGLILLQLAFVYLPFMNALFDSAPLHPWAWGRAALVASVVWLLVGLEKFWRRRARPFREHPGGAQPLSLPEKQPAG